MSRNKLFDPSHQPSDAFKEQLKARVLQTYYGEEKKNMQQTKRVIWNPFTMVIGGAFAALALSFVIMAVVLDKESATNTGNQAVIEQDSSLTEVTVDPEYANATPAGEQSMSMSLNADATTLVGGGDVAPTPKYKNVEEAVAAVGFRPLVMSKPFANEQLSEIYSFAGFSGGSETTLHFSFGDANTKSYEMIQTKAASQQEPYPPEAKIVQISVLGRQITALHNTFWDASTSAEEIYPGSPRQSLSFVIDGLSVDITEYGTISLEDLVKIAGLLRMY